MVKHKGLIYSKSLHRLRHVEFHIDIFDRSQMCDHMTVFFAQRVLYSVASLWNIAYTRIDKKFPKGSPRGFGWSIRVHSLGNEKYPFRDRSY
jgi:hypothetical protein